MAAEEAAAAAAAEAAQLEASAAADAMPPPSPTKAKEVHSYSGVRSKIVPSSFLTFVRRALVYSMSILLMKKSGPEF